MSVYVEMMEVGVVGENRAVHSVDHFEVHRTDFGKLDSEVGVADSRAVVVVAQKSQLVPCLAGPQLNHKGHRRSEVLQSKQDRNGCPTRRRPYWVFRHRGAFVFEEAAPVLNISECE